MSSGKLISDGVTNSKLVHKTMSLISNDGGRGSREMPSAFLVNYDMLSTSCLRNRVELSYLCIVLRHNRNVYAV